MEGCRCKYRYDVRNTTVRRVAEVAARVFTLISAAIKIEAEGTENLAGVLAHSDSTRTT